MVTWSARPDVSEAISSASAPIAGWPRRYLESDVLHNSIDECVVQFRLTMNNPTDVRIARGWLDEDRLRQRKVAGTVSRRDAILLTVSYDLSPRHRTLSHRLR